jgi:hypothetical protein
MKIVSHAHPFQSLLLLHYDEFSEHPMNVEQHSPSRVSPVPQLLGVQRQKELLMHLHDEERSINEKLSLLFA